MRPFQLDVPARLEGCIFVCNTELPNTRTYVKSTAITEAVERKKAIHLEMKCLRENPTENGNLIYLCPRKGIINVHKG